MTDPWGDRQPSAVTGPVPPLPPRLSRLAQVAATGTGLSAEDPYAEAFPRAGELPEVRDLVRQGWRPLNGAPLYCLLPAAWTPEHRTWVPDRLPRVAIHATTDTYRHELVPPTGEDEQVAGHARAAGLPDPPAGRIWLLRSPWPRIPVTVIEDVIWSIVERTAAGADEITQVYHAARDVLAWPEPRVLATCPAEVRDLLEAWADGGRVGEAAAPVIEQRLGPADAAAATRRTGLDEQTLLDWLASLNAELDDTVIDAINAWRSAGLPGNPPPGAHRFAERDPAEVRAWLDAGFDLYAAARLGAAGLDTALRWRQAGFGAADTYELLRADPALTPDEARAFDTAGPAARRRREWIYYGFGAADAADWTAAGISPANARLWRACGRRPADVRPGQRVPPQLAAGRRYVGFVGDGSDDARNPEWDEIPDPPGTRGRRARRRAGDDDPSINTD